MQKYNSIQNWIFPKGILVIFLLLIKPICSNSQVDPTFYFYIGGEFSCGTMNCGSPGDISSISREFRITKNNSSCSSGGSLLTTNLSTNYYSGVTNTPLFYVSFNSYYYEDCPGDYDLCDINTRVIIDYSQLSYGIMNFLSLTGGYNHPLTNGICSFSTSSSTYGNLTYGISPPSPTWISWSELEGSVVEGLTDTLKTEVPPFENQVYRQEFSYRFNKTDAWITITDPYFTIPTSNYDSIYFRSRVQRTVLPFEPKQSIENSTKGGFPIASVQYSPYYESNGFKIKRLPQDDITYNPIICTGGTTNVKIRFESIPSFIDVIQVQCGDYKTLDFDKNNLKDSTDLTSGKHTLVFTYFKSIEVDGEMILVDIANKSETREIADGTEVEPQIVTQPTDQTVCEGSSAEFTVTASGYKISGYSWSKDGGNFISGTSNYSIPKTSSTNAGSYRVKVSNVCGDIISNPVKLTVNNPSIVNAGITLSACQSLTPESILLSNAGFGGGATAAKWSIINGEGNLHTDFTREPDTVRFVPSADYSGEVTLRLTTNNETGCSPASADRIISVNPLPANQSLTSAGNHCYTESGEEIKLTDSQKGVSYQLKRDGDNVGSLVNGTDNGISFGTHRDVGVYSVVATNILTNCEKIMTNTLTINPLPQIFNVEGGGSFCIGGEGVEIILSDSETDVNYQLVLGGSNVGNSLPGTGNSITFGDHKVAGEYTVVATSNSGCVNIMSGNATIAVNPLPQIFKVTGGGSYCEGGEGVEISLSGSQTNVSYSLLDNTNTVKSIIAGTGNIISFGKIQDIGSYTVEVANNTTGCSSIMNGSASVSITSETPVSIILDANKNAVCEGGGVMFEAKPQFTGGTPTYTWYVNGAQVSGSSSTYNATLNESSTINVKVVPVGVVCPSSSEVYASQNITVNKLPIANAGVDSEICENSSITLGQAKENNVNYSWVSYPTGFTSEDANPTVMPSTTTIYTLVTQSSTTGCTNTDSVTVTVNPNPMFSILPVVNNRCFSGKEGVISFSASGGTPPYRYSVDNGETYSDSSTIKGLIAQEYFAKVIDTVGCTAGSVEVEITQPADSFVLSVLNHNNITCFGGSDGYAELKVAQGGKSPFEYSSNGTDWYNRNIFTGLSANTSKFYVKDSVACIVEVDNPITQPAQIVATKSITNITCKGGNSGKISLSVEGGTGSYTLALTANGKPVETKTNVAKTTEFTGLLAGTYTLTVTDASNCSVVVNEIEILEPENPLQISSITPNQPLCYGYSNGQITVGANGGWDDSYLFNLSGTYNNSGVFSGVAAGSYTISITDNLGCTVDSTYTLGQPPLLELNPTITHADCFGNSTGKIELKATGGTLNYTYEIDGISGDTRNNLYAGDYTVNVTDANGCITSKVATISQPDLLKVSLSNWNNGGVDKTCTDTVRVTPTGGTAPYIIKFEDNSTYDCPNDGYLLHSLPNGTYKFLITDSHSCSVEDSATVSNLDPPTLALVEAVPASCSYSADGSITVKASSQTGSVSVRWENDFVGNTLTGVSGGQYTAVATDLFGCTRTETFTVGKPDTLIINDAIPRSPTCYGGADGGVRVTVNGGTLPYLYQWSNGVQADSTGAVPSGEYTLTVNDGKGCVANKHFTITDPQSIQPNLPDLITLCSNQTYIADAGVPGKYFVWFSNNGFSATTAKVELTQSGDYYLMVTDDNGCTGRDTLRIESYAGLIDADFLMTDKAFVGDTVVLIEMSWPIPQSIEWIYPVESFNEIFRNEYSVLLIPQKEGNFNIGLVTFAGPCTQYLEKPIIIGPAHPSNGDSKDNLTLFKEVVAYPNPNNGNFELFVDMNRESNIMVEVFTMYGKRVMLKEYRGLSTYRVPTTINQISGMYLVRVTSGSETRSLRVVIQ